MQIPDLVSPTRGRNTGSRLKHFWQFYGKMSCHFKELGLCARLLPSGMKQKKSLSSLILPQRAFGSIWFHSSTGDTNDVVVLAGRFSLKLHGHGNFRFEQQAYRLRERDPQASEWSTFTWILGWTSEVTWGKRITWRLDPTSLREMSVILPFFHLFSLRVACFSPGSHMLVEEGSEHEPTKLNTWNMRERVVIAS